MQRGALHTRHKFHDACVAYILNKPVDDGISQLAMSHLTALEAQRCLDLVAFSQKADGLVFLGLVVVLIDSHRELYFLDGDDLLLLAGGALALVFLVEKLAVILNAADGWNGGGRNFDQIKPALTGDLEGFKWRQNAELLAVFIDDAYFTRADSFVGADKAFCRTLV